MRGYWILGAVALAIVLTQGLAAQEVVKAPSCPNCPKNGSCDRCTCGSCGDKCPCTYPNECAEMHWVSGSPEDPGYYLCTNTHVWGALYPDGKFRAYTNGQWAANFSEAPIAPPTAALDEDAYGACCDNTEAYTACQACSQGSCEAGPVFRTPVRSWFHRHRPVRRLLRWAFCGC